MRSLISALELLEYDQIIEHEGGSISRKGALLHVPDALSRMYKSETEEAVTPLLQKWLIK